MVPAFLARLRALSLFVCLGCADRGAAHPTPPAVVPLASLPSRYDTVKESRVSRPEVLLSGPVSGAPAMSKRSGFRSVSQGLGRILSASAPAQPGVPTPERATGPEAGKELIELEATLVLETSEVDDAARRARSLVRNAGGEIVTDTFEDNRYQSGYALSLRVPSERALPLIESLTHLGKVRSQKVQATDVSRRIADADTVLKNLELTLTRYQELAKKAESIAELTTLEAELDRVRTSIDRVKTDMAWMRDRVSGSTIYLQLARPAEERIEHEAKLYPGARLPFALTLDPDGGSSRYLGGGLSVLVSRAFNVDLDVMTDLDGSRRQGLDFVTASAGVELYSNLLGAGRRPFFNPYFGFRAGYANRFGDDAVSAGGSAGLELVRTSYLFVALDARGYALLGTDGGTELLFQPGAVLHVAY